MGNSQARSGGGLLGCCSTSGAEASYDDYPHGQQQKMQPRRIIYSTREMEEGCSGGQSYGNRNLLQAAGAQYQDSVPLQHTYRDSFQKSPRNAGTFSLKEQMRVHSGLVTGILSSWVKSMSFSQRKYMGFRCKYEYDAKALLLCTEK